MWFVDFLKGLFSPKPVEQPKTYNELYNEFVEVWNAIATFRKEHGKSLVESIISHCLDDLVYIEGIDFNTFPQLEDYYNRFEQEQSELYSQLENIVPKLQGIYKRWSAAIEPIKVDEKKRFWKWVQMILGIIGSIVGILVGTLGYLHQHAPETYQKILQFFNMQ